MNLTRHQTPQGPRWAYNGQWLPESLSLGLLLELPQKVMLKSLADLSTGGSPAQAPLLAPIEAMHEVWASGVTYLRSRDARQAESAVGDVYQRVYQAERPELFMKAIGWRVVGHQTPIRVRTDSQWDVPEPELTLVINRWLEIVGYCAGNDVSSRSIEGENPLYLAQAKIYNGACSLGPGIVLTEAEQLQDVPIQLQIIRSGQVFFTEETRTAKMKRTLSELVTYLGRELTFPQGVFLMTGTGIVPPDSFTLQAGDRVQITVAALTLENEVEG